MSDKIVSFPTAEPLPENPISIKRNDRYCRHDRVSLDEHQRTVNCLMCGGVLDAFAFLHKNAAVIQTAWHQHSEVMRKVREVQQRIDLLEKERKRLAGQVKRLQDKAPSLDLRGKDLL